MLEQVDSTVRRAMWDAVEDSMGLGAALLDDAGRVVEATPGLARVFGDDLAASILADHLATEDRDPLARALRDVASGVPERVLRLRPPAHSRRDALELRLLRAADPSHPFTAVVSDRSELDRMEQRLVHAERLRLLGELLLGCTHDLNNLLAVIVHASELASDENLDLARRAAEDARQVVARLHQFGRPADPDEAPVRVEAAELVRDAVAFTRPRWELQARAAGATIRVETRLPAGVAVRVVRSELRHALVNLILNAIDAMPRGGVLRVSCTADAGRASIRIADTGIGFTREVRDRMVEPFFTTKGERGMGLGLSLVSAVVNRFGGSLAADSTPESGTVFAIDLPLADVAEPAEGRPALGDVIPCRILVVEDNLALRALVVRLLRRDGHDVREADGIREVEALALAPGEVDLVIADLSLTGGNGLDLASWLRRTGHRVPFLLTSAWGIELDPTTRRERGVSGVLPKPYRIESLRAAIEALRAGSEPAPA